VWNLIKPRVFFCDAKPAKGPAAAVEVAKNDVANVTYEIQEEPAVQTVQNMPQDPEVQEIPVVAVNEAAEPPPENTVEYVTEIPAEILPAIQAKMPTSILGYKVIMAGEIVTKNRDFGGDFGGGGEDITDHKYDSELFNWDKIARPNQKIPPGAWRNWVILAGRGFGKTRTGAEAIRKFVDSERSKRVAMIGQTIDESRGVMVAGVSGLLSVYPPDDPNYPKFEPSKHQVAWPNGAVAQLFGADRYDCLRGPQFDLAWVDEFAKFRYPEKTYEQLMLCLRLGTPKCIITTTPRPITVLKDILEDPNTVKTVGSTFDNSSNLPQSFVDYVSKQYGSSPFGRQELYGDLLFENQNALWKRDFIVYKQPTEPFVRIVVAVDPAVTYNENSDETGIIVMGLCEDGTAYVIDDASGKYRPNDWGRKVVQKFHEFRADRVVAEVNQGGDLVAEMIKSFDPCVPYSAVRASRGKITRAEPIAALYEQRRIYHVQPFAELEDQLCQYSPETRRKSPDRMDALVWCSTELFKTELVPRVHIWA
jgi:predicted phage terminase large subunit-like protein